MKTHVIIALLFLSACETAPTPSPNATTVIVDSISDHRDPGKSFLIVSGVDGISETDLRFREFAKFTEHALRIRKMKKVERLEDADLLIMLAYGISRPNVSTRFYSAPVALPGSTTSLLNAHGNVVGSIASGPSVGYATESEEVISHERSIILRALDARAVKALPKGRKPGDAPELPVRWETKIESKGRSGDLRRLFPVLLVGAMDYIATDTNGQVETTLVYRPDDPRVCVVAKGMECEITQPIR